MTRQTDGDRPISRNLPFERAFIEWLPQRAAGVVMFILKQAWACLFGILFIIAIVLTTLIWQPDWPIRGCRKTSGNQSLFSRR